MMEPIFAQLSLEYFLAGKSLPWNKVANPETIVLTEGELDTVRVVDTNRPGRPRTPYDRPCYFNLRG